MKKLIINKYNEFIRSDKKLLIIIKTLFYIIGLILLKVPILLLREISLDLVYDIFNNFIIVKIFFWAFEILYYLLIILIIKKLLVKSTLNS